MSEPLFVLLILGEPVPKGRPRMTKTGHAYTPRETRDAETLVIQMFKAQHMIEEPLTCPLRVVMAFQSQKTKRGGVGKMSDLDNYAKLVLDALNGVAFADDSQIIDLHATISRGVGIEPLTRLEAWEA